MRILSFQLCLTLFLPSVAIASVALFPPAPLIKFGVQDVKSFLKETDLEIDTSVDPGDGELADLDKDKLGIGPTKFVVSGKWSTFRFFGPNPAGVGLTGDALSAAQTAALGQDTDTVPVTTAVHTIDAMMDNYFSPLLLSVPGGGAKLTNLKVQGAYYSPKFTGKAAMQYDNAFIVGLQSMILLPNGCFLTPQDPLCKAGFYSAGHDPSVIAHELGHVIFNHMRAKNSLEGFQWFAVNEAYADYFASSYLNDPSIGKIWKSNLTSFGYLRSVLDSPSITDTKLSEEVHRYSNALSSALWRIRLRTTEQPKEFDRVVIQSIAFLGNSEKTRLGDAGLALLKSAEIFGLISFKNIIREELARSGIEVKSTDANVEVLAADKRPVCGVIGQAASQKSNTIVTWLLLFFPICLAVGRYRGRGA